MYQTTFFGGADIVGKPVGPRQARLAFGGFTESGRRGDMPAYWLDTVLLALKVGRAAVPTLTELQAAWDRGSSASDAARAIIRGQSPAEEMSAVADKTHKPEPTRWAGPLALPAPRPVLSLPAPGVFGRTADGHVIENRWRDSGVGRDGYAVMEVFARGIGWVAWYDRLGCVQIGGQPLIVYGERTAHQPLDDSPEPEPEPTLGTDAKPKPARKPAKAKCDCPPAKPRKAAQVLPDTGDAVAAFNPPEFEGDPMHRQIVLQLDGGPTKDQAARLKRIGFGVLSRPAYTASHYRHRFIARWTDTRLAAARSILSERSETPVSRG